MKTESGRCDFCGLLAAKFTINGGLWWICRDCMDRTYGGCTCTEDLQLIHHGECKYAQGEIPQGEIPQGGEEE